MKILKLIKINKGSRLVKGQSELPKLVTLFFVLMFKSVSPNHFCYIEKNKSIEKGGRLPWFVKPSRWEQNVSS
jgi:hypothetical protein